VAEIHTHGGPSAAGRVLARCLACGARLAQPGEFTKRAFMNGRLDLAQAEAVCDMVSARTGAALAAAAHQLTGDLSKELAAIRERLMGVLASLEAAMNFPDEDTERGQALRLSGDVAFAVASVEKLLGSARAGKVLREGVRLVICGKPNVGKSSLLNALLRQDRAIVTDVAGTTRDTLEETADIGGLPVNCIDTAGILTPRDPVEAEAVRRSHASIRAADLVLLVLDRSRPLENIDFDLMADLEGKDVVVVWNKADLPEAEGILPSVFESAEVSARDRRGMKELEALIVRRITGGAGAGNEILVTNMRHAEALRRAAASLGEVRDILHGNGPAEVAADGIKAAVHELDAVTGRDADADLVEQIFARFCIGK